MTNVWGIAKDQARALGIDPETLDRMADTITAEDLAAKADEAMTRLKKIQDLLDIACALEDAGDEQENAAEHLLDLLDASVGDTPLFPPVQVTREGELEIVSTRVLPKGVREFSVAAQENYFTGLAKRHTVNAAAYRREAKRIRLLVDSIARES